MTESLPVMFKVLNEPIIFPGYRVSRGIVENLTSYREDVVLDNDGVMVGEALQFDIERFVAWDEEYKLLPFGYSMMIDGFYPVSRLPFRRTKSRPTMKEFDEIASRLDGFVLDQRITFKANGQRTYRNPSRNMFVNWSYDSTRRIEIGVIQEQPVADLSVVLNEVVPYAVSLFNQLSPTRKIPQDVVEMSITRAQEADLIIPRSRIKIENG